MAYRDLAALADWFGYCIHAENYLEKKKILLYMEYYSQPDVTGCSFSILGMVLCELNVRFDLLCTPTGTWIGDKTTCKQHRVERGWD